MDVLIDSRNNLSHSRELDDYKYNLVIGVCGSINETLENWKMDFNKKCYLTSAYSYYLLEKKMTKIRLSNINLIL
jgi:hypothetical protein